MSVNFIYFTAQGNRRTIPQSVITAGVQGNNASIYKLQALQANGQIFDLTGQQIVTGIKKNLSTNVATPITGPFVVTHESEGEIEWTPSSADTATAADFEIQITINYPFGQNTSYPILWEVVAFATV